MLLRDTEGNILHTDIRVECNREVLGDRIHVARSLRELVRLFAHEIADHQDFVINDYFLHNFESLGCINRFFEANETIVEGH